MLSLLLSLSLSPPLIYTTTCRFVAAVLPPSVSLCDVCAAIETGEDILHLSWEVGGPRKDLRVTCTYAYDKQNGSTACLFRIR